PQDVVVTLSHAGYAKSQPLTEYQTQRRGGRGKSATAVKDEDFVEKLFVAHTHDTVLCFSNRGKVYWLKVYELPQAGRGSGGKAIRFHESEVRYMGREAAGVRGIRLGSGQQLISLIVVGEGHVLTGSAAGYGKRSPLAEFPVHGRGGQGVIALQTSDRNGDTVAALQVMPGQEIML